MWSRFLALENTRASVLITLWILPFVKVSSGHSIKDRATIVEPCTDHRASHCPCSFIIDERPDMTQSSNVEVNSFANIVDLAVEGQSFIKCDSEALGCFRNSNRSVTESHRTDSTLLSIPCTSTDYDDLLFVWIEGEAILRWGRNGSSHSGSVRCRCPSALYRAGCRPRIGCDGSRKMIWHWRLVRCRWRKASVWGRNPEERRTRMRHAAEDRSLPTRTYRWSDNKYLFSLFQTLKQTNESFSPER